MKKEGATRRKSTRKKVTETISEFAESTTIHGFAYLADKKHSWWRAVWMIVVVLALALCLHTFTKLFKDWQDEPVITTLATVAQPIDEIEFPAVTICPQGSNHELLNSALYRQFKGYLSNKTRINSKMNHKEMMEHVSDFLLQMYPGAKEKPTELVKVMISKDPQSVLRNQAILGLKEDCDLSSNKGILTALNKDLNNDSCPDGYEMLGNLYCVHTNGIEMSNNDAHKYCNDQGGAELLYLDSFDDLRTLNEYIATGNILPYIIISFTAV